MKRLGIVLAAALALAPSAHAQREAGGFTFAVTGGYLGLNARESAKAVFDSSGGGTFGAEFGYEFPHWFVSGSVRTFRKDGERAFVAEPGGPAFRLGHPLEAKIMPIQAAVGYRFGELKVFGVGLTPYLGAGGGLTKYEETSTVAGVSESFSETKPGGQVLGGLQFGRSHLRFGVEAGYAFVPNAIGMGGVSQVYGEKDIGGFTVLGKIVFATGGR